MSTFNLPDVGEGLTEADLVQWKVAVGDTVTVNQVLVEIETAKSLVELPSPFAGTVTALHAAEGVTLEVGAPLVDIAVAGEVPDGGSEAPAAPAAEAAGSGGADGADGAGSDPGPLVGSGPVADPIKRRARVRRGGSGTAAASSGTGSAPQARTAVKAKPPVRALAKQLGVDLSTVTPTGPHGEITRADLADYADRRLRSASASSPVPEHNPGREALSAAFGETGWTEPSDGVQHQLVKGVRKATAAAMVSSAFTAPHVSLFVDVDATRTMEFVQRLKKARDFQGVKVTPLLVVAKAVIWAAQRNPQINASWVETKDGAEIQVKSFVNLGIAAATPRGLVVPNIKDAEEMSMKELAQALEHLATRARDGKTSPAEMRDGTISITNVGTLGIDTGTPIINPGECGIIAFGTVRQRPWVVDGEVVPRYVTTVGGSFDHRIVDGDQCARFLADVASILEEPALLLD
jgi:pyruvate dehydrogenase E2 component (dihydrolipoamide acetyltransferase)